MAGTGRRRAFPEGSPGARRRRPTRSRAGTSTTTGGPSSTPRARPAPSRRATPATRGTAGRRTPTWSPAWAWTTTGSPSSGAGSSRPTARSPRPRSPTTDGQCLGLRERGIDPVVTFHHFTTPLWLAAQGGWESDLAVDRFGRFCTVVAEALGDVMSRACTHQRAEHRRHHGLACRDVPARQDRRGALTRGGGELRGGAPLGGRGHPLGRARRPGRPDAVDDRLPARPGGEEKLESIRHHAEDVFLDATEGDDFLGVQVYTRMLIGPDGWAGYEEGVPVLDMGYEFYPAVPRQLPAAGLGVHRRLPAAARHRERHRHHRRRTTHRLRAPGALGRARCDRRGHRRAGLHLLVAARQLRVGVRLPAAVRDRRRRPRHVRPDGQSPARRGWPRWRRPTPSTPDRGSPQTRGQLRVGHDGVGDVGPEGLRAGRGPSRDR